MYVHNQPPGSTDHEPQAKGSSSSSTANQTTERSAEQENSSTTYVGRTAARKREHSYDTRLSAKRTRRDEDKGWCSALCLLEMKGFTC